MKKWTQYFAELNGWIKLILGFCLLGVFLNTVQVYRDIATGGILLRLHVGFLLLYIAQVIFIFIPERMVCVLTVLQGILALLLNADFTFMPFIQLLGRSVRFVFSDIALEYIQVYRYIAVSLAFTLQMLSAFALFTLLPKNENQISR